MNHDSSAASFEETQDGKDVVMENLRQLCVYKAAEEESNYRKFFLYISHIHQLCGSRITHSCHLKAVASLVSPVSNPGSFMTGKPDMLYTKEEFENKINKCIDESFESNGQAYDASVDDNTLLREML